MAESEDYALQAVLDEFGFGDGVVNASDSNAAAMAAEVVRLRSAEMEAMRRKYLDYGHGEGPASTEGFDG